MNGEAKWEKTIDELMEAVDKNVPLPARDIDKPFLMPIEDIFSISGRGTVVTGRIERGKVKVGEEVEIVGFRETRKTVVTGVEMFKKQLDEGLAGDNAGLLLRGTAKEDVEHALELAHAVDDLRTVGAAYFQASLVADREGRWVLARNYAERAREAYAQLADRVHVGQLTNNLGGLNFLLGNTDDAIQLLKEAFSIALDAGQEADAGRAVSSLAQVHLRTGNFEQAEEQARQALDLLDGRVDYTDETGNAQLVLGRSLLEQGRLDEAEAAFTNAEACFGELGSASHRAAAWVARGDLATLRGDHQRASELYRTAAEALQDVRF